MTLSAVVHCKRDLLLKVFNFSWIGSLLLHEMLYIYIMNQVNITMLFSSMEKFNHGFELIICPSKTQKAFETART